MAKRPSRARKTESAWIGSSITIGEAATAPIGTRTRDHELVARAMRHSIWQACNMNATMCASLPIRLYRPQGAGRKSVYRGRSVPRKKAAWLHGEGVCAPGRKAVDYAHMAGDVEEVLEHPILDLLRWPDPFNTGTSWLYLLYFYLESCGRAFLWTGERSMGAPVSLYHLAPTHTKPVPSKTRMIGEYVYGRDSASEVVFDADEVLYLRHKPHPFSPIEAMSWVETITMEGDCENAALSAEISRWKNGGVPGMVIEIDGKLDEAGRKQLRHSLREHVNGVGKAGNALILQRAKLVEYGTKPHEMNYVEGMKHVEAAIRRAADIPEVVWQMGNAALASAERGDPSWMAYCINPRVSGVIEFMTERLLPMFPGTDGWWLAHDNPVQEEQADIEARSLADVAAGVRTINEARSQRNLEPIAPELGDVPRVNGAPIQTAEQHAESVRAGAFFNATRTEEAKEEADGVSDDDAGADDDGGEDEDSGVVGSAKSIGQRGPLELKRKAAFDDLLGVIEASVRNWAEKWGMRAASSMSEAGSVEIPAEASAELEKILMRHMRDVLASGAASIGSGLLLDLDAPDARTFAQTYSFDLVRGITGTMRDRLRGVVSESIGRGLTIDETRDLLMKEVPIFAAQRAEVIARTEMSRAYNAGAIMAGKQNGYTRKAWDLAGGPCPRCEAVAEANKEPIPVDAMFAGDEGPVFAPPLHPNCRCGILLEE